MIRNVSVERTTRRTGVRVRRAMATPSEDLGENGCHKTMRGTSYAAAYVSGLLASYLRRTPVPVRGKDAACALLTNAAPFPNHDPLTHGLGVVQPF